MDPRIPLDAAEVDRMIAQMVGEIEQVPPMYSAVKVNGRKLYEYARAGGSGTPCTAGSHL